MVVVEPEQWVDKEFPLSSHIDIGHELMKGDWIVLMYHYDCPKCQEVVAAYEREAETHAASARRIALVEIPPWTPTRVMVGGACRHGRLDRSHDWFVEAPLHLLISAGKVVLVSRELLVASLPAEEADVVICATDAFATLAVSR